VNIYKSVCDAIQHCPIK